MKLETRLLGTIEYEQEDVLTFPNGLPSFEDEHAFLLLPIEGSGGGLLCLQSVTTPALSFLMMNPFSLCPSYTPVLQPQERKEMGVSRDQELCFYVLCALKRPVERSTVNLKCPIVLNPDRKLGCQVILDTQEYSMHHPVADFSKSKEDASC